LNTKLKVEKDLNKIPDRISRLREETIKRI
jgi:hypothetical protein